MREDYFHIKNVYVQAAGRMAEAEASTLVIETELSLPRPGEPNPELDTLLTEIGDLKKRHPLLFDNVDHVEIRHLNTPSPAFHERPESRIHQLLPV